MNIKNLFKSKTAAEENGTETKKLSRKNFYKRGSYSLIIIAVALACLIVINVLFSALGNRVSLKIDLTSAGTNSISEENLAFVKSIKNPVTITVCADKAAYSGGTLANFAESYLGVIDENGYYSQTINLIEMYSTHNQNITIEYIDLTGSEGSAIANKYPDIFYGDIIVSYSGENGVERERVIGFGDIYTYEDLYGLGYYSITSSKLETALSSAINVVTNGTAKKVGLLTAYCDTDLFNVYLGSNLRKNGFEISEISGNIISEIPEGVDQLYIIYPSKDMLPEEISVLNTWLYNNGERGRSLVFVPGTSIEKIPNIIEFMQEWGISYSDGILYETNPGNYYPGYPTMLLSFANGDTSYTGIPANSEQPCLLGNNLPMTAYFDNYSTKKAEVIYSTSDGVVVAPVGAASDWTPNSDAEKKIFANLIVTRDSELIDDTFKESYVAAFSSFEFLYSQFVNEAANMEVAVNTALTITGIDTEAQLVFIDKTMETESFADQINEKSASAIRIIFVIIVPLALIAAGIFVWLRRKNR